MKFPTIFAGDVVYYLHQQKKVRNLMNPMQLFQIKSMWDKFCANHPRFPQFLSAVAKEGIAEDTIISIEVKTPEGKTYNANLKVQPGDMELVNTLRQMKL